jgi:hypothetical protein
MPSGLCRCRCCRRRRGGAAGAEADASAGVCRTVRPGYAGHCRPTILVADMAVRCLVGTGCRSVRGRLSQSERPLRQAFRGQRAVRTAASSVGRLGRWRPPLGRRPRPGLTSVAERVALVPACRQGLPRPGARTAMSAAGCGGVRLRPSGRLRQCPVPGSATEPRPVSGRHCPPRTLPRPAGVRCYRRRSPGRRPLVGCSHRHRSRASCRPSRSPSWART